MSCPVPIGKFWGLHWFMTLLGGRLSREGGALREGRGPCHCLWSPQDESFLVQQLLSSLPVRCPHPWVLRSSQHGPHTIIKTSFSFQCLLSSHCDENGFCRRGEQWRREAFHSPGLLPLVFCLCPVRAGMTDRLQLQFWLRLWSCAEDSEAEAKPNGEGLIGFVWKGLGKEPLNTGFA